MSNYADLENGMFRNPILFADYSDPDVIRVGDTYYLTASSFNYTPGLPILASKDLVNWKIVNYAVDNIGYERFDIPRHSEGIWAPALRYHDGEFFIFYGMPDEGFFMVKTRNPYGKWEEPVCILEGKGLIDSCPFWDEDGRAYVIHGYAKSRIGFKSILGIFEITPDGRKVISEDHFIFDGNDKEHPALTIEGPKVYKRGDYYYILAPAGGVKDGYQVALRSRNIFGPYEIKEVMHTGGSVINGPHQGGLVDTPNGDEWFIHFQDRGLYGRICHLQPVKWENDWPVIGVNPDQQNTGEPVFTMNKPSVSFKESTLKKTNALCATDDFKEGRISLIWQWLGNHYDYFYGKTADGDGIRLYAVNPSKDEHPVIWKSANVLTQKLVYPLFETRISIDASKLSENDRAGVCMMGGQYVTSYITKGEEGEFYLATAHSEGGDKDKTEVEDLRISFEEVCKELAVSVSEALTKGVFVLEFTHDNKDVTSEDLYYMNVHEPKYGQNPHLHIYFTVDSKENCKWSDLVDSIDSCKLFDLKVDFTPSDHTWVGAKVGIYALKNTACDERSEMENSMNAGLDGKNDKAVGYMDVLHVHTRPL